MLRIFLRDVRSRCLHGRHGSLMFSLRKHAYSTNSGTKVTPPITPEVKSSSGGGFRTFVWLIIGTAVVMDAGIYYVLNSDAKEMIAYKETLKKNLPPAAFDFFKKDGTLNSWIGKAKQVEHTLVEKTHETEKKLEQKLHLRGPGYILEEGMSKSKWEDVKDQLVVMGSKLEEMIAAEAADKEPKSIPTAKEDAKEESAVQTTSEPLNETKRPVVEPKSKQMSRSETIKSKIHSLRTVVLEEFFPENKVSKEVQQKLIDAQRTVKEDLETVLVEDLKLISPDELKRRLVKLILEFKDRSRWEAIRISELLEIEYKKMKAKTDELLRQQEALFKDLSEAEKEDIISETRQRVTEVLQKELGVVKEAELAASEERWSEKFKSEKAELLKKFKQTLDERNEGFKKARQEDFQKFEVEMKKAKAAFDKEKAEKEELTKSYHFSNSVHSICAIFMDLTDRFSAHEPFAVELEQLKSFAKDDAVLVGAVNSIPKSVSNKGMKTQDEITEEFKHVSNDLSKHVLIKEENPSLTSHIMASFVSKLSFDVAHEKEGMVSSDESLLVLAKKEIFENKDLLKGVEYLEKLQPKNKKLAASFIDEVKKEQQSEQAFRFIELHVKKLAKEAAQL